MVKWIDNTTEILSISEMYKVEKQVCAQGITSLSLMEAAGEAIAEAVLNICEDGRILILCGLGNNGGDGFVAARLLENNPSIHLTLIYLLGSMIKTCSVTETNCIRCSK